jgi:hypothetical protein
MGSAEEETGALEGAEEEEEEVEGRGAAAEATSVSSMVDDTVCEYEMNKE